MVSYVRTFGRYFMLRKQAKMIHPDVDKTLAIVFDLLQVPNTKRTEVRDVVRRILEKSNAPGRPAKQTSLIDDCYRSAVIHKGRARLSLQEFEASMPGSLQHLHDWVDHVPMLHEPPRTDVFVFPVLHVIREEANGKSTLTPFSLPNDPPACIINAASLHFLISNTAEMYVWQAKVDTQARQFSEDDITGTLIVLRNVLRYLPAI